MAARGRRRGGSGTVIAACNLLRELPDAGQREVAEAILAAPRLRIERIVSLGQASPPGFWYDQAEEEWVLLLAGAARLRFADEPEARPLGAGDHLDTSKYPVSGGGCGRVKADAVVAASPSVLVSAGRLHVRAVVHAIRRLRPVG